jgi:transposase
MKQFITNLSPDYQLDDFRVKDNVVVFEISSKLKEVNCSYCGQPSSKVHSYYQREVQDLPIQNKNVVLLMQNGKRQIGWSVTLYIHRHN